MCRAQTRGERPRPHDGGVQERLVSILIPGVPGAPFSATVSTESVRMLADGSRITLVNHRAIAPPVFAGTPSAINLAQKNSREDLGKQFIGGLEAAGTRETTVVEPEVIGNDSELHIIREYWYSPQLSINLSSKLQDPRIGTQDFELSNIIPGEPDPKLFKVPPGSEVIDLRRHVGSPSDDRSHE